ncbi:MAG: helical backbone metal receptor [Chloroflexota bacterium]
MPSYTDALGRMLELASPPERILSLVPSLTEALFAFGLAERVAGVTRYCVEPAEAGFKPKVGGTKNVDIAHAVAIQPDLVLANAEENTREDVDALVGAGLAVFVTYPRTVAAAIEELRLLAEMTGSVAAAAPIVAAADEALALGKRANKGRTPVRAFCPIWRNPWMTIGPDTYMSDFLRVCGADNVYGDSPDRYPAIELGDVAERRPEVALLPDEPYRFGEKHIAEVIEKLGDVRIHLVDGKSLCWYGPRIGPALAEVQSLLWGDARRVNEDQAMK